MLKLTEVKVDPDHVDDHAFIENKISRKLGISKKDFSHVQLDRKSIDARKRPIFNLRYKVFIKEDPPACRWHMGALEPVHDRKRVFIIGAGPAGYFAALECIKLGLKPVVYERGKDVRRRRRDLRAIQQFSEVNSDSNYCFGEGGAGTYSDGKLYTRSVKRGSIEEILQILVEHGAKSDILTDAHPHIGSNKLPGIVTRIRETIERFGGEVHFDSRITGFNLEGNRVRSISVNDEVDVAVDNLILATGHSARDIYGLLDEAGVFLEAKPFALGVRIEHPQELIDRLQYGMAPRHPNLPASSYRLACTFERRGVFSFCMCPGGLIVPAATAPGEIVVNGMSLSRRDSPYANSGTVVAVDPGDLPGIEGKEHLRCLEFQRTVERTMFEAGDGSQAAPAQRLTDFVRGRLSSNVPDSSYIPGLFSARLDRLLPQFIYDHLVRGAAEFEKRMKGYLSEEAVVVGTESRTSAPVRIPRDRDTCMHPEVRGLFPCGEGAGFAGGILSAAMDGQRVARQVAAYTKVNPFK